MLDLTQNVMHSRMNLVPASQTYRRWSKILRNQTVAEKGILRYPSSKG